MIKKTVLVAIAISAFTLSGCQLIRGDFTQSALNETKTVVALKTPDKPLLSKPAKSKSKAKSVSVSKGSSKGDKRPYSQLIAKYAAENGVPLKLAHAVVYSESTYNPKARGAAGEIGLMQLRPATARMIGYSGSAKGLYDPATNLKYGMRYLGKAHKLAGGSTCGTILKYNAGHGAKRMNPISQRYCNKVSKLIR